MKRKSQLGLPHAVNLFATIQSAATTSLNLEDASRAIPVLLTRSLVGRRSGRSRPVSQLTLIIHDHDYSTAC